MVNIYKSGNGVLFKLTDNPYSTRGQELSFPSNSLTLLIDNSDIATIRSSADNEVMLAARIDEIFINDEAVTKEDIQEKWILVATSSQGGGGGTGGAVTSVNQQTGDVVLTASSLNAYTKTQVDSLVETKVDKETYEADKGTFALKSELPDMAQYVDKTSYEADKQTFALKSEIPSTENFVDKVTYEADKQTFALKTDIPSLDGYATEEWVESKGYLTEHQDISNLATKEEVTNGLALKVDKSTYDSEKQSFATKSEISDMATQTWVKEQGYLTEHQDISNLATKSELTEGLEGKQDKGDYALKSELPNLELYATKSEVTEGLATKQDKGDYATKEELNGKQDTLISGESIKTINGESILGSGNIEIQGGGGGIADAPSDGNKYVRQNGNWVQETTVDTSNLATKEEISDMLTKTEASTTYQPIGDYATKSELATKLDTSTYTSDKATFALKSEISDMLTKTEASSTYQPKGEYLTAVPDEYVTETELSSKGYLTSIPEEYVTDEELTSALSSKQDKGNYITVETADGKYQPKGEYATTAQLANKVDVSAYTEDKATFALKSELTNFITASVDNLINYYKKSETYTQSEIDAKIGAITTINFEVVAELPVSGEANKIYLVPNAEQGEQNVKDEYIWIENKWELIGSTKIDLSNYYNKGEVDGKLSAKVDLSTYTSDKETFALKSEISDMATQTWVTSQGYLTSHQDISQLATKQEVTEGLAGKQDKGDYALKSELPDISNLATKEELDLKANSSDLSNYLTTSNAETTYAKKSEIPSLDGYLQTSVADEKYATKTELEGKVDDADIADMLTKTEASNTYQVKGEYLTSIPDEYVTETELNGKGYKKIIYITQTQYDELQNKEEGVLYVITDAPEVVIPDTSTFATKEELEGKADKTSVPVAQKKYEKGDNTKYIYAANSYQDKTFNVIADLYLSDRKELKLFYKWWGMPNNSELVSIRNASQSLDGAMSAEDKTKLDSINVSTLATKEELTSKQDTLISGTNIKTVNGNSLLGNGDIVIEGGGDVTKQYVDEQLALKADKTSLNSYYTKTVSDGKYQPKGEYLEENDVTFISSSITEDVAIDNKIFVKTASTYAGAMEAQIQDDKDVYIGNGGILHQIYKKDTLTKTEASTTYALQTALQSALDRISALETQVGNISAQLDAINGEIIQ